MEGILFVSLVSLVLFICQWIEIREKDKKIKKLEEGMKVMINKQLDI